MQPPTLRPICTQSSACAKNVACGKLDLCRSNCAGSTDCPNDCTAQYPDGKDDYNAFTSDHTASGIASTPINPNGPGSNWCGATFIASSR